MQHSLLVFLNQQQYHPKNQCVGDEGWSCSFSKYVANLVVKFMVDF